MGLELEKNDGELIEAFRKLHSKQDVARLLEVDYTHLNYLLYHHPANYTVFNLPKKSGGSRTISTPVSSLKILQRKLAYIFSLVYKPRFPVHGFTHKRDISTNCRKHCRRNLVLNIDIEDFFGSINFGRVRGLLIAKPYEIKEEAATILAQICCHNNQLPQGAPTSPIVSNMICARMDRELQQLAKDCRSTYTRYADDITFSTTLAAFPSEIVASNSGSVKLGNKLVEVIESNGFNINYNKVSLKSKFERQVVTGLTTNSFPNVRRTFVRQIRAMLHAWEKYGLNNAQEYHITEYRNNRHRNPELSNISFARVVQGKINFLRMVKGEEDNIYRKFAKKYVELAGYGFPAYYDGNEQIYESLWVLESLSDENMIQGTGFALEGVGIVTCHHVIGKNMKAFLE